MPLSKTSKRRVKLSKVNIRAKKKITRRENGEGRSTLRGRLKNRQTLALDIVVALHKICPIASPLFFSPKLPPPLFISFLHPYALQTHPPLYFPRFAPTHLNMFVANCLIRSPMVMAIARSSCSSSTSGIFRLISSACKCMCVCEFVLET